MGKTIICCHNGCPFAEEANALRQCHWMFLVTCVKTDNDKAQKNATIHNRSLTVPHVNCILKNSNGFDCLKNRGALFVAKSIYPDLSIPWLPITCHCPCHWQKHKIPHVHFVSLLSSISSFSASQCGNTSLVQFCLQQDCVWTWLMIGIWDASSSVLAVWILCCLPWMQNNS